VNYVIYLDVFFIINLLMDFLILLIVRRMVHRDARWFRSLIGAVIGATYICIIIVLPFGNNFIFKFITYFVISFIMVRVSFGIKGLRNNLKPYALLFVTTFLLGGILNALYFYTEFGHMLGNVISGNAFEGLNLLVFILCAAVSYVVLTIIVYMVKRHKKNSRIFYKVNLQYHSQIFTVTALLDTGNSLIEPISRQPVNLVEYGVIKENLGEINFKEGNFRMIPFHSVGKKSGLIPGFNIDQITIEKHEEKIIVIKPMIGIYDGEFSNAKEYQMLLHPTVLNS
jgi:stage II sporulation protein GA (sporulation sigma-E factor processing peptidase)